MLVSPFLVMPAKKSNREAEICLLSDEFPYAVTLLTPCLSFCWFRLLPTTESTFLVYLYGI